jgi:Skp family chaperone for outer membrane proteins
MAGTRSPSLTCAAWWFAGAVLLFQIFAPPAVAQQGAPFLFINQEQILLGSEAGQTLLDEEERRRNDLVARARSIDAAFEEEERELTEKRETTPAEEFRKLADDFDARVVAARKRQDEKSDALAQELEQKRREFYAGVAPILVRMMERFGARAIFDENSVLLADQRLNITDAVIAEIDKSRAHGDQGDAPADDDKPTEDTQP